MGNLMRRGVEEAGSCILMQVDACEKCICDLRAKQVLCGDGIVDHLQSGMYVKVYIHGAVNCHMGAANCGVCKLDRVTSTLVNKLHIVDQHGVLLEV